MLSLEPVNAASAHAAWTNVAHHALTALKRKRARGAAGSSGFRVRLALESKHQLPSGRAPGLAMSLLGIPLKKAPKKNVTGIDTLKPHASLEIVETPDPGGGAPLRGPTLQLGVQSLGVKGDPVDIGANARRVVSVRVTDEQPL